MRKLILGLLAVLQQAVALSIYRGDENSPATGAGAGAGADDLPAGINDVNERWTSVRQRVARPVSPVLLSIQTKLLCSASCGVF